MVICSAAAFAPQSRTPRATVRTMAGEVVPGARPPATTYIGQAPFTRTVVLADRITLVRKATGAEALTSEQYRNAEQCKK